MRREDSFCHKLVRLIRDRLVPSQTARAKGTTPTLMRSAVISARANSMEIAAPQPQMLEFKQEPPDKPINKLVNTIKIRVLPEITNRNQNVIKATKLCKFQNS